MAMLLSCICLAFFNSHVAEIPNPCVTVPVFWLHFFLYLFHARCFIFNFSSTELSIQLCLFLDAGLKQGMNLYLSLLHYEIFSMLHLHPYQPQIPYSVEIDILSFPHNHLCNILVFLL